MKFLKVLRIKCRTLISRNLWVHYLRSSWISHRSKWFHGKRTHLSSNAYSNGGDEIRHFSIYYYLTHFDYKSLSKNVNKFPAIHFGISCDFCSSSCCCCSGKRKKDTHVLAVSRTKSKKLLPKNLSDSRKKSLEHILTPVFSVWLGIK